MVRLKEETRIFLGIVGSILFLAFLLYLFTSRSIIGNHLTGIFSRTIGSYLYSEIIEVMKVIFNLFLLGFLGLALIYVAIKSEINGFKANVFLIVSFLLVGSMVFLGGMLIIDKIVSPQEIKWYLHDENSSQIVGEVECFDFGSEEKIILAGNTAFCSFDLTVWRINDTYINSYVEFKFVNGSTDSKSQQTNSLTFVAPENIRYLSFRIHGKDLRHPETYRGASTGLPHNFPTLEEYKKDQEKFLAYVLALFGLILFIIPRFILDLKEIVTKK